MIIRFFYAYILLFSFLFSHVPEKRVVAEWEPAIGTIIRWPLGIPSDLVVELASDDALYVLVENNNQQIQARNNFNDWGINLLILESSRSNFVVNSEGKLEETKAIANQMHKETWKKNDYESKFGNK